MKYAARLLEAGRNTAIAGRPSTQPASARRSSARVISGYWVKYEAADDPRR